MTRSVKIPEINWVRINYKYHAMIGDYVMEVRHLESLSGDDKFTAIVNHRALTSGSGPCGYFYANAELAKYEAETAVKYAIEDRVNKAIETIELYTEET